MSDQETGELEALRRELRRMEGLYRLAREDNESMAIRIEELEDDDKTEQLRDVKLELDWKEEELEEATDKIADMQANFDDLKEELEAANKENQRLRAMMEELTCLNDHPT